MTGVPQFGVAAEDESAAGPALRQQRGGEVCLWEREPNADVAALGVPIGCIDADVDWLVSVGEGPDPAAYRGHAQPINPVDPASDAAQRLALVHRDVRLSERPR